MRWTLNALRRIRHYGLGVAMISAQGLPASPSYQIDVWRADEGLPQGTVTSIAQTPDGYLWLGTQNGLVRFDGVRFQVFNEKNREEYSGDQQ
ncbi:MAG: two-component regulator propeller domain-containing protein [Verrucomicrobiota bacterium]